MTEEQAIRAEALLEAEFDDVHVTVTDPSHWFSLNLDRWSTEMVRDALLSLKAAGGDARGLLEDIEDWLTNQAEPYPGDAETTDVYHPINS